jgi:hypothetical protein
MTTQADAVLERTVLQALDSEMEHLSATRDSLRLQLDDVQTRLHRCQRAAELIRGTPPIPKPGTNRPRGTIPGAKVAREAHASPETIDLLKRVIGSFERPVTMAEISAHPSLKHLSHHTPRRALVELKAKGKATWERIDGKPHWSLSEQ